MNPLTSLEIGTEAKSDRKMKRGNVGTGKTINRRKEIQRKALHDLVSLGEPKFTDTWFPYTSGEVGPYYLQSVMIESDGGIYHRAIRALAELIEESLCEWEEDFDCISGGESRDWDFSNPTAYALKAAHVKLYKNGKTVGAPIEGQKIIHVADLNNQGSSMRDKWVPMVRAAGGRMDMAFFYVDRNENGIEVMKELKIKTRAVITLDEHAWGELKAMGYISPKLYRSLMLRLEDRHNWGRQALLNHPEGLGAMLESKLKADRDRGRKVLFSGYPEIRLELLARLRKLGYSVTPGELEYRDDEDNGDAR
jgi:orotate phosphoribosyltransferase